MGTILTSVRLDQTSLEAVDHLVRLTGHTRSQVIRDALVEAAGDMLDSAYADLAADQATDPEHAQYRTAARTARTARDARRGAA